MDEPFKFRRYRLELGGRTQGAFAELDPPGARVRVIVEDGRARADNVVQRTHATLVDGVADTRLLAEWLHEVGDGPGGRRELALVELSDDGRPAARHLFSEAWPVRLKLAALSPAELFKVDELELAVGRWTWSPAAQEEPEPEPASP